MHRIYECQMAIADYIYPIGICDCSAGQWQGEPSEYLNECVLRHLLLCCSHKLARYAAVCWSRSVTPDKEGRALLVYYVG